MSVIKFNLTEQHLSLVRNLRVMTEPEEISIIPKFYAPSPFSLGDGTNSYDDVYAIIYGKMPNFDPMNAEGFEYKDGEVEEMDKLLSELPIALDIVLYFTGEVVEPGLYKTKYHVRDWKKIK